MYSILYSPLDLFHLSYIYIYNLLNTSSPEDQQHKTLSCEFLSYFIIILTAN